MLRFTLPAWLDELLQRPPVCADSVARVRFAIELSKRNVERRSGGPFGAAVFAAATGELVGAGVNLVLPERSSLAHAEIVALTEAQARLGRHDLSDASLELATSSQPCIQCFGAIWWSGVSRLSYAAGRERVEAAGFEEGPVPPDWIERLEAKAPPVRVISGVLASEAGAVLAAYRSGGGRIYNPGEPVD